MRSFMKNTKLTDKENSIDYETLENILDNPIHSLRENYINVDAFEDLNNLKNTIIKLSNNKNYSKYELLVHMVNFKNIYEKFRPSHITNSDVYFGTVKKIEEIFVVLFWYIGIKPLFYFSKFDQAYIKSGNYSHEEINWKEILDDVESLINSIIIKIEEKAFDLLCELKKHTPSYCLHIIFQTVRRFLKGIDVENIDFDFDNNKLIIDKTIIEIDNYWSIKLKMIEILKNKEST
jgi:hypothetical protein